MVEVQTLSPFTETKLQTNLHANGRNQVQKSDAIECNDLTQISSKLRSACTVWHCGAGGFESSMLNPRFLPKLKKVWTYIQH